MKANTILRGQVNMLFTAVKAEHFIRFKFTFKFVIRVISTTLLIGICLSVLAFHKKHPATHNTSQHDPKYQCMQQIE